MATAEMGGRGERSLLNWSAFVEEEEGEEEEEEGASTQFPQFIFPSGRMSTRSLNQSSYLVYPVMLHFHSR